MLQAPLPGAEQVRRALDRVYAREEFVPASSPASGALADFWRALRRFLARLLPDFGGGGAAGEALFYLLVALMAAVAVGVLLHLTDRLPRAWRLRDRGGEGAAAAPGRSARAADWERRAREAARGGRWREAALALYQALLLRMEERGAVRYDPAKTPGDYRREARRGGPERKALEAFLRGFEPVAFGGRELDEGGYARLRAAAGEAGAHG